MSRFKRLAHSIWYCNYHIVWVPKYRFRILQGEIKLEVIDVIENFSEHLNKKMGEVAYKFCKANFTLENQIRIIESIYCPLRPR